MGAQHPDMHCPRHAPPHARGTLPLTQGILTAEEVAASGDVMLRITLLAAGFVIGERPLRT